MSYMPHDATELLTPSSLILGNSQEPLAIANRLASVTTGLQEFASRLRGAQSRLETQRGSSVKAIHTRLAHDPLPGAKLLTADLTIARQAFLSYSSGVHELNAQGWAVLGRVDEHLRTIRQQSGAVQHIAYQVGV